MEQHSGKPADVSFELLTKGHKLALELNGPLKAVIIGHRMGALAKEAFRYGVDEVLLVDHPDLADYKTMPYSRIMSELVDRHKPRIVLYGATIVGRDLAPRVAARLGVGLESDCTDFALDGDGRLLITRPIYAGKIIATVKLKSTPQVVTVRPNVLGAPEPDTSRTTTVEAVAVDVGEVRAKVVDLLVAEGGEVPLAEATIIVSGGRGVKGPEGFEPIRALVKALGGSMGASRAAVDAGWIEHSHQVGQTGKTVTPNLYVACGISGAIQHLAGMKTSKVIVAINKDPEAPIFNYADYGIVGDLFAVVPLVEKEVKTLLAK